ncbi:hypothetical protein KMC57_gp79 [Achromobacter phage vB_AxyP_19-32_Axy24]|uniref:Uncharacterized protein n=1 Tax=Achromobacter phage vB_AxyP_19-32_Axy24 TaxID=2591048 RepID=A0A514CWB2_9CAUD|nr:hypothetical protein KMC57_gp79 [Achromobacter phage vB_AxyP_19-32_Axy24]QDH84755.1 hypothetical protein Axy24_039 [Achromobacter phage vB_AxyP_19-32_Axy24]
MRTPFFRPRPKKPVKLPIMFRGSKTMEDELRLVPFAFMDAIARGDGDIEAFLTLVFRVLCGLGMCQHVDQGEKVRPHILKALGALWHVGDRMIKKHRVGFSGDERNCIRSALVMIDDMHVLVTRKEHREIISIVGMKVGGTTLTMQTLEPYKEHL